MYVKTDLKPEPDEQFTIELVTIETTGISQSGKAALSRSKLAYILLGASNDPHGVVEFSSFTQPLHVKEDIIEVELQLIRHQGKIG